MASNDHDWNCSARYGYTSCTCKPVEPKKKSPCGNCWADPDWCGCDVYFEFKGTISGAEAKKVKAKRNASAGLTSKSSSESY